MESKIFAKINFDPGILVIISLIISVVLLIVVISLLLRQSRLEVNYKLFMRGKNAKSLEEAFRQQFDDLDLIQEQTELLHKRMMYVEKSLNKSFQKCGIVRYDAFKEIGGQLSFAYALLNDSNTGFVMNCIHSREGSYTYIKDVVRGECELPLSEEESTAIYQAINFNSLQSSQNAAGKKNSKKKDMSLLDDLNPIQTVMDTAKPLKKFIKKKKKGADQVADVSDSSDTPADDTETKES